ncbi:hypothetical protein L249_7878 [Ophiocordyceps polyrhachis-furcata BCC 54312]|uniref:Uncharacterized protein n=1 Tax=Ophiocordyceps polyrhachis-furcata BCC 54312 TaxID=1330021 RepID=A0A367L0L4_9HYPO|nr:hypothetical protein L249_7878 [Ophiocordyceps polyrhachis-furcata BCC 54312]
MDHEPVLKIRAQDHARVSGGQKHSARCVDVEEVERVAAYEPLRRYKKRERALSSSCSHSDRKHCPSLSSSSQCFTQEPGQALCCCPSRFRLLGAPLPPPSLNPGRRSIRTHNLPSRRHLTKIDRVQLHRRGREAGKYEPGGYHPVMMDDAGYAGKASNACNASDTTPTVPSILHQVDMQGPNGTHTCYTSAPTQAKSQRSIIQSTLSYPSRPGVGRKSSRGTLPWSMEDIHLRNILVNLPPSTLDTAVSRPVQRQSSASLRRYPSAVWMEFRPEERLTVDEVLRSKRMVNRSLNQSLNCDE